jgi:hypothetical protein
MICDLIRRKNVDILQESVRKDETDYNVVTMSSRWLQRWSGYYEPASQS